ncbi:ras-related protein Rab-22A-like [Argonauta hians]
MALRDVKICLLGDSGVGKTSIVWRFVTNTFRDNPGSTIGASFMVKNLVLDSKTFRFQIWDTAGQEKYHALAPMYFRGAAAAIVVYDITKEASFRSAKEWVKRLRKHGVTDAVIALAGNKCDSEDLREVSANDAQAYANSIQAIFVETSALVAVNIPELFTSIAQKLPPINDNTVDNDNTVNMNSRTSTKSCCFSSSSTNKSTVEAILKDVY